MVKLFGWEAKMRERVGDKREEELNYIWKKEVSPIYILIYALLPDIQGVAGRREHYQARSCFTIHGF